MTDTTIIYEPAETKHWKMLHGKKRQLLGSQNLNPGEELVLTIAEVLADQTVKGENGREDVTSMLKFKETDLPMCLNITNSKTIAGLYGDYTDKWIGQRVQLYSTKVNAKGQSVSALRVREFVPNDPNEDLTEYIDKINAVTTVEELTKVWKGLPKRLHGKLTDVAAEKKKGLAE